MYGLNVNVFAYQVNLDRLDRLEFLAVAAKLVLLESKVCKERLVSLVRKVPLDSPDPVETMVGREPQALRDLRDKWVTLVHRVQLVVLVSSARLDQRERKEMLARGAWPAHRASPEFRTSSVSEVTLDRMARTGFRVLRVRQESREIRERQVRLVPSAHLGLQASKELQVLQVPQDFLVIRGLEVPRVRWDSKGR